MSSTCRRCGEQFFPHSLGRLHVLIKHPTTQQSNSSDTLHEGEPNSRESYGLRVYQTAIGKLAEDLCSLQERGKDQDFCREGYKLLVALNTSAQDDTAKARLLATGCHRRTQMDDLAFKLGLSHDRFLKAALRRDEMAVMQTLKDLILSDKGYKAIIALKSSRYYSEWLLNLIDKFQEGTYRHIMGESPRGGSVPSPGSEDRGTTSELKCRLYRIDVELSTASDLFPSSLIVKNVRVLDENSTRGGHFADVYKAELQDGTVVAVKKLRQIFHAATNRVEASRTLIREASLWKNLKHPNVLPFLGLAIHLFPSAMPCMVSSWAEFESIDSYIRKNGFVSHEVHRLLFEIARGLSYLHEEDVVHGDLRVANILVDGDRHVRLADFGLATFAGPQISPGSTRIAAGSWPPPETFDISDGEVTKRPTNASDMFALSAVCWEIHCGEPPFAHLTAAQVVLAIHRGYRPDRSDSKRDISSAVWNIMEQCWEQHPKDRPTAIDVVEGLKPLVISGSSKLEPPTANQFLRRKRSGTRMKPAKMKAITDTSVSHVANVAVRNASASVDREVGLTPRMRTVQSGMSPASTTQTNGRHTEAKQTPSTTPAKQANIHQGGVGNPPSHIYVRSDHWSRNEITPGDATINPFQPCEPFLAAHSPIIRQAVPMAIERRRRHPLAEGSSTIDPFEPCEPFNTTCHGIQFTPFGIPPEAFGGVQQTCLGACYAAGVHPWCPLHSSMPRIAPVASIGLGAFSLF